MSIWLPIILIIVGVLLLIKGADWLVDGASRLARYLKIPVIIIGIVIVSFGTSLPEFIIDLAATIGGQENLSLGNILGSNIINVLLILGLCLVIKPMVVKPETIKFNLPLAVITQILLFFLAMDIFPFEEGVNILSRADGVILLAMFVFFLWQTIRQLKPREKMRADSQFCQLLQEAQQKSKSKSERKIYAQLRKESCTPAEKKVNKIKSLQKLKRERERGVFNHYEFLKTVGEILLGLALLAAGGNLTVRGASNIAQILGVSETLIGLTVVGIGTSLPELAASLMSIKQKQTDIAIGNIIGSNIFNFIFLDKYYENI